ncbi:hypothetical protein TeGR_g107, partial [Tetraparma gracilis]
MAAAWALNLSAGLLAVAAFDEARPEEISFSALAGETLPPPAEKLVKLTSSGLNFVILAFTLATFTDIFHAPAALLPVALSSLYLLSPGSVPAVNNASVALAAGSFFLMLLSPSPPLPPDLPSAPDALAPFASLCLYNGVYQNIIPSLIQQRTASLPLPPSSLAPPLLLGTLLPLLMSAAVSLRPGLPALLPEAASLPAFHLFALSVAVASAIGCLAASLLLVSGSLSFFGAAGASSALSLAEAAAPLL